MDERVEKIARVIDPNTFIETQIAQHAQHTSDPKERFEIRRKKAIKLAEKINENLS
jgi:hypothetical protein